MGFRLGPMPQMCERTLEMAREIMEQELWLPIYEQGGFDALIRARLIPATIPPPPPPPREQEGSGGFNY